MPQNWWELFPEVQPSPFARRRPLPLPGPGAFMPGSAMMPRQAAPYGAFGPDAGPPGAIEAFAFAGGEPEPGELPAYSAPATRPDYRQPPLAGEGAGSAMDRDTAIQHADAAIQRGADPDAVRARLHEMGHAEMDPPSPFSDLLPDARQAAMTMKDPGISLPREARPSLHDQGGLQGRVHPAAYTQGRFGSLQRRADPRMAPQKVGDAQKMFQPKEGVPLQDRAGGIGRAIVRTVNQMRRPNNPPAPNLTPWQSRRRRQNEVLASEPRIRAFLDAISLAEGNTDYGSLYGNHHQMFTDRSTHPGNVGQNGGGAAGRYQILPRTYRALNRLLGPYTMSDSDQDLMAIELIREGQALEPLLAGNIDEAISRLGVRQTWASFPVLRHGVWAPNPSGQRTEDIRNIRARFNESLARASRPGPGVAATGNAIAGH